ncbi:MAG: class I adenylate-forming enzyme family protein [Spirochaetota bacterium]
MNELKEKMAQERYEELLPNMADYISFYKKKNKNGLAIIEFDTGETVTWAKFDQSVNAFSAKLLSIGLKKGDIVATSLPLLKEHIYLLYACYRIGVIIAPLDLRLKAQEVQYCLDKIEAKAYFFLGHTPVADFRPIIAEVMKGSPYVKTWVQFQQEPELVMEGAVGIGEFVKDIKKVLLRVYFLEV